MSEQDLRAMVREVLREALGKTRPAAGGPEPLAAAVEQVRLANDRDLARFVARIVALLDDPARGSAVRSGALRFSLCSGRPAPMPSQTPTASADGSAELSGTVTEAKINKAASSGRIVLAPDAVITPLARDRARALGLKIERRR